MDNKKECRICKLPKELERFPKHSKLKDGRDTLCKECKAARGRERYSRNSTQILERARITNHGKNRWIKQKLKKYSLTQEDYTKILLEQNGRCAICNCLPEDNISLSVDHSHITGNVRGLLCRQCNFMLGHARDNIEILKKGIKYLEG